jgi:hypothetical protein
MKTPVKKLTAKAPRTPRKSEQNLVFLGALGALAVKALF